VTYYVLVDPTKISPKITGDENIKNVEWHDVNKLPELGFDHREIIEYALKRVRYKLEYSVVGLELLPDKFTLTQLQKMYEIILGESIDKRNFRKKISSMNFLKDTAEIKKGSHRPAKLYTFRKTPASNFKKIQFEK
jgi:8-oxo-dGTP diphosphatase